MPSARGSEAIHRQPYNRRYNYTLPRHVIMHVADNHKAKSGKRISGNVTASYTLYTLLNCMWKKNYYLKKIVEHECLLHLHCTP